MMRTIKFRAKCIADSSTWVYGSLAVQGEAAFIGNPIWINVNPDTVGQFTGLLDCNGVEIYEGDVLIGDLDENRRIVTWIEDFAAGFVAKEGSWVDAYPLCKWWIADHAYKVIGNIHDNPELLSDSK